MPDEKTSEGRALAAMVENTEVLTHLKVAFSIHAGEYAEGRKAAREFSNSLAAKVDNLDRSVSEMRLGAENGEKARHLELKRIYDLLGEERKDRRDAISDGREGEREAQKSEREMLRRMIKEELAERRDDRATNRHMLMAVSTAIWAKGGQYIVLAFCLLIVAGVLKMANLNLIDFIGISGGQP